MTYVPAGLIILAGPAGCGKSTLAQKLVDGGHLPADAVISTDAIRAELFGDAADQQQPARVFATRDQRVEARLRAGLPVLADSTSLDARSRRPLIAMAKRFGASVTVVRCLVPINVAQARNVRRDRVVPREVIVRQFANAQLDRDALLAEGVDVVVDDSGLSGVLPVGANGTHLGGPLDFIGDVHGQFDTLLALLTELGYRNVTDPARLSHPRGRIPVFLGDLNDKGPRSLAVLRWAMAAHRAGRILVVKGNHEAKLARVLTRALQAADGNVGKLVEALAEETKQARYGLASTLEEIRTDTQLLRGGLMGLITWMNRLPMQIVFDNGQVVGVHASMHSSLIGADRFDTGKERRNAERWFLYGPTTGREDPETGFPERIDWAPTYDGDAVVVHGHVVFDEPTVRGNVVSLDTGAGEGSSLSAFRWPERTFVTVDVTEGIIAADTPAAIEVTVPA